MKKIIGFLLAVVMLLSAAALLGACAKKEKNKNEDVDSDDDYLTGLDFNGAEIRFVVSDSSQEMNSLSGQSVSVEERDGDTVSIALYDRNALIESRLNVDIQLLMMTSHTNFTAQVQTMLDTGTDEFDVFMAQQANDIDLCLNGDMVDLNKLSDYGAGYLNFDGGWWATNYMQHYEYGQNRYWLSGGFDLLYIGGVACTIVNANMYDAFCKGDFGEIYTIAKEGNWNLDLMAEMCKRVWLDGNLNDKLDYEDRIGYTNGASSSFNVMELMIATGIEVTKRGGDGSLEWIFDEKNKSNVAILERLYSFLNDTDGVGQTSDFKGEDAFRDGKMLFYIGRLSNLSGLREMQDDFYLIPTPKLNDAQDSYRCSIQDSQHLIGIPYTVPTDKYPAIAATLELMAYQSNKTVNKVYYNEVLKQKYARDEGLAAMVDLCHDSAYTDFGLIWEKYLFGTHWLRNSGISSNPTSAIKKYSSKWKGTFDETIEKLNHPVVKT